MNREKDSYSDYDELAADRKRIGLLVAVMAAVVLAVTAIAMAALYSAAFNQQRQRLIEIVNNETQLIESMLGASTVMPDLAQREALVLAQLRDAHSRFKGFGETGEFTLARREGNNIDFLLAHRHSGEGNVIPFISAVAEPMRRALSGDNGILVGPDYRGERVLAAHMMVPSNGWGVVAKIDVTEIRAPFIRAGVSAAVVALVLIAVGTMLFVRITRPMLQQIAQNAQRLRSIAEASPVPVAIARLRDGHVLFSNKRFRENFKHTLSSNVGIRAMFAEADGRDRFQRVLERDGRCPEVELEGIDSEGGRRWLLFSGEVFAFDGEPAYLQGSIDLTARREAEEKVRYQANYDAVTDLPNRWLSGDRLKTALARAQREEHKVGVLALDIGGFRRINETMGHDAGDSVLRQVADRFRDLVRKTDTLARLGGDQFILILPNLRTAEGAETVYSKLLETMRQPVQVQNREMHINMSIGIAVYPDDADDEPSLLRCADVALRAAKHPAHEGVARFVPEFAAEISERLSLESDLIHALERHELYLAFQPQIDLASGAVIAAEALMRWNHSERGNISPGIFIPLAENSVLIDQIGRWVLNEACRTIKHWRDEYPGLSRVAVNVSPRQFARGTLCKDVEDALSKHALAPEALELEITEGVVMTNPETAIAQLNTLRMMGVRIALDDFGTGHSSLAYLRSLPLDILKIDRQFMCNVPGNEGDAAVAATIIDLASQLDLEVVAEGVENAAQLGFLTRHACSIGQGYLFSRPIPAEDLPDVAKSTPWSEMVGGGASVARKPHLIAT